MFRRLDRSAALSKLLAWFSEFLAQQRGLPVVIGIILIVVALVIQVIDAFSGSRILEVIGLIVHSLGVLIALVGLLLAIPLGK